ncbi:MAG TPA: hypothetical protein VGF28_10980 [Thermoanaerobaculia bacterium]|jgi:hypothetical protein
MNRIALVLLALLLSSAAGAAEYSDLYVVPIAGHVRGAFGTAWRTDVVLHNIQPVPITVELAMVESGRRPSADVVALGAAGGTALVLMPGETRTLSDVAGHLGRDLAGALIAGADQPFALTSRTWAELPSGRTLGQSVVPVAIGGEADAVNEVAVLPSLAPGARQRANVGFFAAASHAPLVVEVALRSPSGASLGSRLVVLDEPGFVHRQLAVPATTEAGGSTAVIRILQGDGVVIPYASVIDNVSAESLFVSGQPVAVRGAASRGLLARAVLGSSVPRVPRFLGPSGR